MSEIAAAPSYGHKNAGAMGNSLLWPNKQIPFHTHLRSWRKSLLGCLVRTLSIALYIMRQREEVSEAGVKTLPAWFYRLGFDFRLLYFGVFLSSGPLTIHVSSPVGPALIETQCSSVLQKPKHSLYPGKLRQRQFFHYNNKNKTENNAGVRWLNSPRLNRLADANFK